MNKHPTAKGMFYIAIDNYFSSDHHRLFVEPFIVLDIHPHRKQK